MDKQWENEKKLSVTGWLSNWKNQDMFRECSHEWWSHFSTLWSFKIQ